MRLRSFVSSERLDSQITAAFVSLLQNTKCVPLTGCKVHQFYARQRECATLWPHTAFIVCCKTANVCHLLAVAFISLLQDSKLGSGGGSVVERRTIDRKVPGSSPGRSGGRIFFSVVNFLCWLLFRYQFHPMLPQQHVKDPGHSSKSAGYS